MTSARKATFGFTKLIVNDEEAQAEYYHQVYGLNKLHRVQGESSAAGGSFREVIMGPGEGMGTESLVMFKFTDRPAPRDQEAILGFMTEDLDALAERVLAHGGKHVGAMESMPEHGVRVIFTTDPEGRLAENVQLLGH
jgi:predicted enzyme related to lactoylglutathione lyase